MKNISLSTKLLPLALLVFGSLVTACEPHQLQVFKEVISTETKNAIDVLPADAAYVGMMNPQDLKSNEYTNVFGSTGLMSRDQSGEGFARMQDFIDATGFNPEEDLKEIYVAVGELTQDAHPGASIVAYASIDQGQLQSYVEERVGDELNTRSYRGIEVFEGDDREAPSFSFVNDNMIIAATSASLLEDMIDRLEGEGSSLSSNDAMMKLLTKASAGESGWFVAQKPPVDSFNIPDAGDDDLNQIARSAQQVWTALDHVVVALNIEQDGLGGQVSFYPNNDVSSDDLASLMNGMIALAKANPDLDEKGLAMLDDIRAKSSGDHAYIDMFLENNTIKTISFK